MFVNRLFSAIGYKVVWLVGVFENKINIPYLALLFSIMYFCGHIYTSNHRFRSALYVLTMTISGLLTERLLFQTWVYSFTANHSFFNFPTWLIAMWIAFPCMCEVTLNTPLRNKFFTILFGLFACPLPYLAVQKLGLIQLINQNSLVILSVSWVFIMIMFHIFINYFLKNKHS